MRLSNSTPMSMPPMTDSAIFAGDGGGIVVLGNRSGKKDSGVRMTFVRHAHGDVDLYHIARVRGGTPTSKSHDISKLEHVGIIFPFLVFLVFLLSNSAFPRTRPLDHILKPQTCTLANLPYFERGWKVRKFDL